MELYTDDLAERLKSKCGQKWQPSNGTEGCMFMDRWCANCKHNGNTEDDYCEIQTLTMVFDPSDDEYPQEWQISENGQPVCTAFLASGNEI